MRKSTKLSLVAAAAAVGFVIVGSTTASTASNTVPDSVAGFGEGTVSGATVTAIHYVNDAADPSTLDSVVFDSSTDITGTTVTMTLKDGSLAIMGTPYSCSYTAFAAGSTTITCLTADLPSIASLGATDLTVVNS
jgi:hypothetical protein